MYSLMMATLWNNTKSNITFDKPNLFQEHNDFQPWVQCQLGAMRVFGVYLWNPQRTGRYKRRIRKRKKYNTHHSPTIQPFQNHQEILNYWQYGRNHLYLFRQLLRSLSPSQCRRILTPPLCRRFFPSGQTTIHQKERMFSHHPTL